MRIKSKQRQQIMPLETGHRQEEKFKKQRNLKRDERDSRVSGNTRGWTNQT